MAWLHSVVSATHSTSDPSPLAKKAQSVAPGSGTMHPVVWSASVYRHTRAGCRSCSESRRSPRMRCLRSSAAITGPDVAHSARELPPPPPRTRAAARASSRTRAAACASSRAGTAARPRSLWARRTYRWCTPRGPRSRTAFRTRCRSRSGCRRTRARPRIRTWCSSRSRCPGSRRCRRSHWRRCTTPQGSAAHSTRPRGTSERRGARCPRGRRRSSHRSWSKPLPKTNSKRRSQPARRNMKWGPRARKARTGCRSTHRSCTPGFGSPWVRCSFRRRVECRSRSQASLRRRGPARRRNSRERSSYRLRIRRHRPRRRKDRRRTQGKDLPCSKCPLACRPCCPRRRNTSVWSDCRFPRSNRHWSCNAPTTAGNTHRSATARRSAGTSSTGLLDSMGRRGPPALSAPLRATGWERTSRRRTTKASSRRLRCMAARWSSGCIRRWCTGPWRSRDPPRTYRTLERRCNRTCRIAPWLRRDRSAASRRGNSRLRSRRSWRTLLAPARRSRRCKRRRSSCRRQQSPPRVQAASGPAQVPAGASHRCLPSASSAHTSPMQHPIVVSLQSARSGQQQLNGAPPSTPTLSLGEAPASGGVQTAPAATCLQRLPATHPQNDPPDGGGFTQAIAALADPQQSAVLKHVFPAATHWQRPFVHGRSSSQSSAVTQRSPSCDGGQLSSTVLPSYIEEQLVVTTGLVERSRQKARNGADRGSGIRTVVGAKSAKLIVGARRGQVPLGHAPIRRKTPCAPVAEAICRSSRRYRTRRAPAGSLLASKACSRLQTDRTRTAPTEARRR